MVVAEDVVFLGVRVGSIVEAKGKKNIVIDCERNKEYQTEKWFSIDGPQI